MPDGQADGKHAASVEVLTAEVRVLMVGSRQVTLSVFGQLDEVDPDDIEPFGRVSPRDARPTRVYVVGRDRESGALVRSSMYTWDELRPLSLREIADASPAIGTGADVRDMDTPTLWATAAHAEETAAHGLEPFRAAWRGMHERCNAEISLRSRLAERVGNWEDLPLIVLAGLR